MGNRAILRNDHHSITDEIQRVVEILVSVDYAGAIHRVALTLKFE